MVFSDPPGGPGICLWQYGPNWVRRYTGKAQGVKLFAVTCKCKLLHVAIFEKSAGAGIPV